MYSEGNFASEQCMQAMAWFVVAGMRRIAACPLVLP